MDTCTEEEAALSAFVNVVHMIELHPNISRKHTPLVTSNDVYVTHIYISNMNFSNYQFLLPTFSGTILS